MSEESLQVSFWITVLIQTLGSIDMPGHGTRKMPSPRQYVAIVVAWLVLMLIAGTSETAARAAKAVGWTLVLASMFVQGGKKVSPAAQRLLGVMNSVGQNFNTNPPSQGGTP